MKKRKSRFGTIFSFTFSRHTGRKGYRTGTILGGLLCFLAPLAIMVLAELLSGREDPVCGAASVYVVDQTGTPLTDTEPFQRVKSAAMGQAEVLLSDQSFEETYQRAKQEGDALLVVLDDGEEGLTATVIRPEGSALSVRDEEALESYLNQCLQYLVIQKSGLGLTQLTGLNVPVEVSAEIGGGEETDSNADSDAELREILGMLLPYLNIMVLYFLILFYGQSVANCVLLEKTSKLMDTMLLSAKPGELLLGTVLGTVLAAFLQALIWVLALAGGLWAGTFAVLRINPGTELALIRVFEGLQVFGGLFSLSGCAVGCLMILAGFLLYCALGAISGALAGKPEDLSSTSFVYVLILLVSFFVTLRGTKPWMDWVPFTAVLVTPGRMLAGNTSFLQGLGSLAVVLLSSLLVILAAGKLYRTMALYKGKLPGPGTLLAMLREKSGGGKA